MRNARQGRASGRRCYLRGCYAGQYQEYRLMSSPRRVVFYVDGFNLYYGLRRSGLRRCYWLDPQKLAQSLLRQDQALVCIKYFTSMITPSPDDPGKVDRQLAFVEAIQTLPLVRMFYGQYQDRMKPCEKCKADVWTSKEKMTDVNIAVELLTDAYEDAYDDAILVSADADLVPPIRAVRRLFPNRRVVAAFPPGYASKALRRTANAYFTIGEANLRTSLLPDNVTKADGFVLTRPATWI